RNQDPKRSGMNLVMTLVRPLVILALLTQQNSGVESKAKKVITAFLSGEGETVSAMFKSPPPPAMFKQANDQLTARLGKFESIGRVTLTSEQALQIATASCNFEKGTADIRVAFNAAGELTGLRIVSVNPKTVPWDPPAYADPQKFTERNLTLGTAPWELPAILTLPKGAGPFPAVVLVQGSGPEDEDETIGANKPFKDLAWGLASNGIAVFRYKKRTAVYAAQMASVNITV